MSYQTEQALQAWDDTKRHIAEGDDEPAVDWRGDELRPTGQYIDYNDDLIEFDDLYDYLMAHGAEDYED